MRNTWHQQQKGSSMQPRSILTSSTAALAALLIAGCGVFAPEDSEGATSAPKVSAPAVDPDPHSTGLEHVTEPADDHGLADGAARPENAAPAPTGHPTPGQTVFTLPDGPDGQPGPTSTTAPLPAPEELNSDLMVAPGEDQQGSVGQPRHPHAVPERLWNGEVPLWAECTDEAALAANADHEPAGWPSDHQQGDPLPSPLCHPDFIEMLEWKHYHEFMACCEGLPNGTTMVAPGASEQRVYQALWDQSQARADWSPGDTEIDETW